jgi:hypothetical protein
VTCTFTSVDVDVLRAMNYHSGQPYDEISYHTTVVTSLSLCHTVASFFSQLWYVKLSKKELDEAQLCYGTYLSAMDR